MSTITYVHGDFLFLVDCTRSVLSSASISIFAVMAGSKILTRRICPIRLRNIDVVVTEIHVGGSVVNSCKCRKILVSMRVNDAIAKELS